MTGHKVQWKSGAQTYDATRQNTVLGAASNSAVITGLTNSTQYTVRVTAYNDTGDGTASTEVMGTPAIGAPLAPAKPTVSAGNARVTLTWTAPGDNGSAITGYEYVKKEGAGNFEPNWTTIPNSASLTTHTVTGLTNCTEYRFKLRAVNSQGNGAESPQTDAVTAVTVPAAPAPPPSEGGGGGGAQASDPDDEHEDPFTDDNGSVFEESINKVAAADITRGCDSTGAQFCPNQPVTRGQMATFLARALDL